MANIIRIRKKPSEPAAPTLDLVDADQNSDSSKSLGQFKQWIDDGQSKEKEIIHTYNTHIPFNFRHFIELKELGIYNRYIYKNTKNIICKYSDHLFSNNIIKRFQGNSRVFCSDFSSDGNVLCVASQDHVIHLIDSSSGINNEQWKIYKQVESQFSGWSIIDVALSPDHSFVAYSGWSSSIYLVNTYGSHELHEAHDLNISSFNSYGRCCVFGIEFDPNSKKLICALSGGALILHDLERKFNEFALPSAHDEDVNQATFLDTNIIISGSDDALLKVWDTRQKNQCIGGFIGHYQGITCVSTPNDFGSSNYVLSNSKDQSMKLWDLRCMNGVSELISTRKQLKHQTSSFDYRYRGWNPRSSMTHDKKFRIDKSLVTYKGHSVSRTLCRSGFSPIHCTSAKYVYCGSADCSIYIYNILDASIHSTLRGHSDIVRDVCWHPYLPIIVSASWDGSVVTWGYQGSSKDGTVIDMIDNDGCITVTDSGSDSDDNEESNVKAIPLDMPRHLRKRNDRGYW